MLYRTACAGRRTRPAHFFAAVRIFTYAQVAFFVDTLYDGSSMTRDEARQILLSLLAEKGTAVSPDAGEAELARLTLAADPLPDALVRALSEVFDAVAGKTAEDKLAE